MRHGTTTAYRQGCRCDQCKQAQSEAFKKWKQNRVIDPDRIPHGTTNGYGHYRCRCDDCLTASRDSNRAYRQTPEGQQSSYRRTMTYAHRHPERKRAHEAVMRAIRRGDLVRPSVCEHCHEDAFCEASHTDYARQLEVEWLCSECHRLKDGLLSDARAARRLAKIRYARATHAAHET